MILINKLSDCKCYFCLTEIYFAVTETKQKIYFPGLNGLRFFASFAVIITHTELIKMAFGFENSWKHPIIFNLGGLGVFFFFVLSGFLITYLLLAEKESTNTISIKEFYLRRIFRIWPLYYLIFILGFFILPHFFELHITYLENDFNRYYKNQFWTYLLILPNLGYAMHGAIPHIGHLWTIGVEEQFYLLWPLLLKTNKKILRLLLLLIIGLVTFKLLVLLLSITHYDFPFVIGLKNFIAMLKIECMAIGGIGAYILFYKKNMILKIVYNFWTHVLAWVSIPLLIYFTPEKLQNGNHIVYSIAFLVIILNVAGNKKSFVKLENKIMHSLGSISYGIYMYHLMLIPIILLFIKKLLTPLNSGLLFNAILYTAVISTTCLISFLSYNFFEKKFLLLKRKYTNIISGEPS